MARSSQDIISLFDQYVIPNYTRYPVALVRGDGPFVWDAEGNRYIDFFPGWGCNMFGHCPKPVVKALQELPNTAVFIWKEYYLLADLTGHIFMDSDTFFLHELDRTSTLASWLSEAVNDNLFSPGPDLLEETVQ